MESEQDRKTYRESGKNTGISLGYDISSGKVSGFVSAGKSRTDSDYESVTDQAGIYAGDKGFDISVKDNTHLKSAVIDSKGDAEKNTLRTGTLSWEDVENKADYRLSGKGIAVNKTPNAPYNEKGITPSIPTGSSGKAGSTTRAGIAPGTIMIQDKDNQRQDMVALNRNTRDSLNRLGEIFNKTKVEERQELAGLFGKLAFNKIHEIKGNLVQKAALHATVGAIMAKLNDGDMLLHAGAATINKLAIGEINKIANGDADLAQWISGALGYIITGSYSGASVTISGTKNNFYHLFLKNIIMGIDPHTLKNNEAYAVMFNGSAKVGGVTVGCFIAKNPYDDNDLIIYDNTGGNLQFSLDSLPIGVSVSKVVFNNKYNAVSMLEGVSVGAGIDMNNVHIGVSIPATDIINSFVSGNWQEQHASIDRGVSSTIQGAIQIGLSYTQKIGSRNDENIWNPYKSEYEKAIMRYIEEHPNEPLLLYNNINSGNLYLIRDGAFGKERLINIGDYTEWQPIKIGEMPDPSESQIVILGDSR